MTVATDSPFTEEELEPTLRPLLEASLLPARSYTDESVAAWEARNMFLDGWICVGHASAFAERGGFVTHEIAGESLLFGGGNGFSNAAPGSSPSPRGPSAASSARITRGATASTARSKTRRTPTG